MSNPLLLVVEDDQNLAKLLEYNLNRAGYRSHLSGTGEDGLEQLSQKSFDLVLLDVMLPGMDGFELCRKIRQHQRYKDIPIIMVTAKGEGRIAKQIIATAKAHGIPIEQNEELTTLLATVRINEEIPSSLYNAAAQLIAFLYFLNEYLNYH